jgi:hypothetical protein
VRRSEREGPGVVPSVSPCGQDYQWQFSSEHRAAGVTRVASLATLGILAGVVALSKQVATIFLDQLGLGSGLGLKFRGNWGHVKCHVS